MDNILEECRCKSHYVQKEEQIIEGEEVCFGCWFIWLNDVQRNQIPPSREEVLKRRLALKLRKKLGIEPWRTTSG